MTGHAAAAAEQIESVELAGGGGAAGDALDFLLHLRELFLQVVAIDLALGAVVGHDGQLRHAAHDVMDLLQPGVGGLQVVDLVLDVPGRGGRVAVLGPQTFADSQARRIVARIVNAQAG